MLPSKGSGVINIVRDLKNSWYDAKSYWPKCFLRKLCYQTHYNSRHLRSFIHAIAKIKGLGLIPNYGNFPTIHSIFLLIVRMIPCYDICGYLSCKNAPNMLYYQFCLFAVLFHVVWGVFTPQKRKNCLIWFGVTWHVVWNLIEKWHRLSKIYLPLPLYYLSIIKESGKYSDTKCKTYR